MRDVVIDARDLLPPEPLERALTALDLIGDTGELTLILNQRPYPLFGILSGNGYRWHEGEESGGGFRYRISKR